MIDLAVGALRHNTSARVGQFVRHVEHRCHARANAGRVGAALHFEGVFAGHESPRGIAEFSKCLGSVGMKDFFLQKDC